MIGLEREITFSPAYDKRHKDPKKNYGIHGVTMTWIVKGDDGAVQWVTYTNWHLPHIQKEQDARADRQFPHLSCHPMPADLGYHSKVPRYEGQEPMGSFELDFDDKEEIEGLGSFPKRKPTGTFTHCEYTGGPCYYDGSGLNAEPVFKLLVEKGSEAVWEYLEQYYRHIFEGADWPSIEETNEVKQDS